MNGPLFRPVPLADSLKTPLLPSVGFRWAFAAAMVGALGISSIAALAALTRAQRVGFVSLAIAMLVLAFTWTSRDRRAVAAYWLFQTAAATTLTIVSRSDAELSMMAVLAQTVLIAPRWFVVTFVAYAFSVSTAGSLRHGISLSEASFRSLTVVAGCVFVMTFTELVIRESQARARAAGLVGELEIANARLRELAASAEELAAIRERARIARDVHDIVGHSLTAAHAQLTGAIAVAASEPARSLRLTESALSLISDGIRDVRRSVAAIHGGLRGPFVEEVRRLLASIDGANIVAVVTIEGKPKEPSSSTALGLYRIVQECLTNSLRHAHPSKVSVTLRYGEHELAVCFEDDGVGAVDLAGGFGLRGVEERIAQLGGEITIDARPSAGVRIDFRVPLPPRG